jgi:streptogramin lyase
MRGAGGLIVQTSGGHREVSTTARRRVAVAALGALLLLIAASGSRADVAGAAPAHPFLASLDGSTTPDGEFDTACGVAVDSEGDVYVANNGKGAIDVFDAAGGYLTEIADANGPCDLAVDSMGNVYAVDTATGNVVKYHPDAYPPVAGTSYGPPLTFDSSAEASAVAVNPADDRVYVASPSVVTVYNADGTLGEVDEVQRLVVNSATGGTYELSFEADQTGPLPYNASPAEVEAALEALPSIGAGNVSVTGGQVEKSVTFIGALAGKDVERVAIACPALTGAEHSCRSDSVVQGFSGHVGEGVLTSAFGVDVWGADGHVYVGDEVGKVYVFDAKGARLLTEIDGSAAVDGAGSPGAFGALPQVNVAVDQANGHVFVSDVKESGNVYEFEQSGPYFSQLPRSFQDAGPTDLAVDPSSGATQGDVYVTSGSGPGSHVDAFGPLPIPSHPSLPSLPKTFNSPCGVAVDSHGDVYVTSTGNSSIDVFRPEGKSWQLVKTISDNGFPCGVAVDAAGNLFVAHPNAQLAVDQNVLEYSPSTYPPTPTTAYSAPKPIDVPSGGIGSGAKAVAVNPANQHLLVAHSNLIFEYDAASNGSGLLRDDIGAGLKLSEITAVGVYGKNGNVYAWNNFGANIKGVNVFDPATNERLVVIDGSNAVSKKPDGVIGGLGSPSIAVDQGTGHVFFSSDGSSADVYEFEASGAYVSRFGRSANNGGLPGVAVDNSGGANSGDVFVAGGINGPPAVDAYRAVSYGEPPAVVTGAVGGANGTEATLEGTVDPRGFALEGCQFQYVDSASFESSEFAAATTVACAETPAEIGSGSEPVAVHADISGLSAAVHYHYRLTAKNKYGLAVGEPKVFGPLVVTPKAASPVLYTEATLRASIDPGGLPASYRFEYGESEGYGHSTPITEIPANEGPVEVSASLFGLSPQTTYHFRILANGSFSAFTGPDQTLTTSAPPGPDDCPNAQQRSGASASLPDCRAYELVTPDLNGLKPESLVGTTGEAGDSFDTWLGAPGGDSLIFDTNGSAPGVAGNGTTDQYRTVRGEGGWSSGLIAPSGAQMELPHLGGSSSDHRYAFWTGSSFGGSLEADSPQATYLRHPDGSFELLGQGSLGEDLAATGRWIGGDGGHVIFTTKPGSAVQLEPNGPAAGIAAIYDRTPDGVTHVVSLLPGEVVPTSNSKYLGVSADGSAVFFEVGGKLYERRDNAATLEVAPGGSTFAGASEDGGRAFYVRPDDPTSAPETGNVFAFDADSGETTQLTSAGGATVVNVSADGSHVYLVSPEQLDGSQGIAGASNLYVWDGAFSFIATLSAEDMKDVGSAIVTLAAWTKAVGPDPNAFIGPGAVPARSTPDGSVFVFQSFANLTPYDSEGHSEIYRFDLADPSLVCLSCVPDGDPPSGEAELQQLGGGSPVNAISHIPNVTADGEATFFQTTDALVSADGDNTTDVYEWRAGRVSLISSGKSAAPNYLYGMSADGRDVYFETNDSLLPQDQDGGDPSIYDARVKGGFSSSTAQSCLEDGCQGAPAAPPRLPAPASSSLQGPPSGVVPRCPRGKRLVRRHGRPRCVKKAGHHKSKRHERKRRSAESRHGGGR